MAHKLWISSAWYNQRRDEDNNPIEPAWYIPAISLDYPDITWSNRNGDETPDEGECIFVCVVNDVDKAQLEITHASKIKASEAV